MSEEVTSVALLVGTATDGIAAPPALLRSPVSVQLVGVGTPPVSTDALWARAYSTDGFVIAADADRIALDSSGSSGPDPKHLVGALDLHFILSARGYTDLSVLVSCSNNPLPITAAYTMAPLPFAIRGRVTSGDPPLAVGEASVSIGSSIPPVALPPPTTTAADGTYAFPSMPAARSMTLTVGAKSQTVTPAYPEPVLTVNFAL